MAHRFAFGFNALRLSGMHWLLLTVCTFKLIAVGMKQARFLLPLAWLVRVADTTEHRSWLNRVATDLLASQDTSTGSIKQEFGKGNETGRCSPCAPSSNEQYGSGEGPIMYGAWCLPFELFYQ
jgi:hypothetical protein